MVKFIAILTTIFGPVLGGVLALILGGIFGVRVGVVTLGFGLLIGVVALVVLLVLVFRSGKVVRRTVHEIAQQMEDDPTMADLIRGRRVP